MVLKLGIIARAAVFLAATGIWGQPNRVVRIAGGVPPPVGIQSAKASLGIVLAVAIDGSGKTYLAADNCIFRLDPGGILTRVAGTGMLGYSDAGRAGLEARIRTPTSVAFDARGNLYYAALSEIRRIDGSGTIGIVLRSLSSNISAIAFDASGNLYAAYPLDHQIRKITPAGAVTVFAGNGEDGRSGDGGPAMAASLGFPISLAIDRSQNLYIADTGEVRKVSPDGIITRVAGGGVDPREDVAATDAFVNPFAIAVDGSGNLLIGDETRVRRVTATGRIQTVAGSSTYTPEGRSPFGIIRGLAADASGNILVAHQGGRLDRIDPGGAISTIAGNGSEAPYSGDGGPAVNAQVSPMDLVRDQTGNVYFTDYNNHVIRKIAANGIISTVAGTGAAGFSGDGGPAASTQIKHPWGIAADAEGSIYFVDQGNKRIRKIAPDGRISTVWYDSDTSNSDTSAIGLAVDPQGNLYFSSTSAEVRKLDRNGTVSVIAGNGTIGYSGDGGPATAAQLFYPEFLAADGHGNLYIADTFNERIRKVSADGTISTVAGGGTNRFAHGVPASGIVLSDLSGIAVDDAGSVYISEFGAILKVTPDGIVRFVALTSVFSIDVDDPPEVLRSVLTPEVIFPSGLSIDSGGNIWVADRADAILEIRANFVPSPHYHRL